MDGGKPAPVLGLRENWRQFALLVLVNAFVGAMVGLERTVLPLLADAEFGLASTSAALTGSASLVGVVAGGIDVFYPPENEGRQNAMFERGLVLAEARVAAKAAPDKAGPLVTQARIEARLAAAIEALARNQGADRSQWRWGRMHARAFPHPFEPAFDLTSLGWGWSFLFIKVLIDAGIEPVGAFDIRINNGSILGASGDRTYFIEAPAKHHGTAAANGSKGGT